MDDRSEKIVTLAREIMHRPVSVENREGQYSLKTVALAAMLSAAGAGGAVAVTAEYVRPLNRYERVELQALIYYIAQKRHISAETLRESFFVQFGVGSFDDLSRAQMQQARDYLQRQIP